MPRPWIAPLAALLVAAAPLAQAQTKDDPKAAATAGFVQQALKSGEEDVAIAKLAAEKSQNGEIKQFAQILVSDHTAVNEQLALLAKRDGAAPAPKQPGQTDSSSPPSGMAPGAAPTVPKVERLNALSGAAFDKQFLALVIDGHEKAVELYQTESQSGASPATKKLASETLPKIKEHLEQAKSLRQQVKDKN